MDTFPRILASAIFSTLALCPSLPGASAAVINWTDATGFWDVAGNWDSNPLLPGAADDVVINVAGIQTITHRSGTHTIGSLSMPGDDILAITGGSLTVTNAFTNNANTDISAGTLTLNGVSSMASLTQGGGILGGTGAVTITGASTWTAGTHTGAGTTQFDSTLAISGATGKSITGGRSVNAGNTTWSGNTGSNNTISMASTSAFNNTGTFTDANAFDSSIVGGTFNNSGTFNKQSNTTTTMSTVFNNTGTVNVNAGTMLMQSGGTSTGTFDLAAGAKIEFRNGAHTLNNVTTSGAGTLQISTENVGADAVVTINGGTLNSAFLLSGSTMNGTDQVFQGPATWTGGTINGTAAQSTTFGGTLTISGANGKVLSGGRSLNAGNTTWSGNTGNNNNAISLGGSGTFNNTGSFTDANAFNSSIGSGTFNNNGTFNKQSNTTTSIGTVFNSTGTVNVNAGTMLMNGGGTVTGVFNIADAAKLEYRNGSHTLNNVTTSGAGTFEISTENVGADAIVSVNGGTHTTAFVLSGSTLTGTSHTFQGLATWSGGTITGAATASTTFSNALAISGPNSKALSGGRSVNAGDTTWTGNTGSGNNNINISGASVFNSSGTFTDANTFNSAINVGNGGGAFNNSGIFNKQSNTTTSIGTQFNSTGTVNVNAGTMLMNGGGTSTGVFNIAAGAKLEYRNGSHTLNNVTTSGDGTFEISTENVGADAIVSVNGGTHTTAFVLSGSTMAGIDATFSGPATWTGGGISGAATTTFDNDVTISGANLKTIVGGRTVVLNGTTTWSGNTADNNNAIRFWNGATINNNGTFNDANQFASFIEHNVGGPHNFNNIGTYNKQSNTVTTVDLGVVFNNSGTLNLDAGTTRFVSGTQGPTGTVQVASGATFQHDAASTVGNLITAGTLALSNRNLTVHIDYNNTNFGVGNAFNHRANVTGTGLILAATDTAQAVTGTGVTDGSTTAPTLTIGNVHVGANTYAYQVANTGVTGPAIRGALQTEVNGGNITDPRLSGSGVTASNFGPIATGANSGDLNVVFTAASAGALAPLSGQAVHIINNFDNVADQTLSIVLGAGAAAYNLAAGDAAPSPVTIANQRVGGTASQLLNVSNTAPSGSFTEGLNASFGVNTGDATNNSGSINLLAGGVGNGAAMSVGVNTGSAGAKSGTVTLNYISDGAGTSGLGLTNVGSQVINVSGNVYRLAQGAATPTPVNFGNRHVGDAASQVLTVQNTAANDGFSESLNASFGANTGAATNNAGNINLLAAGGSNASAMSVGLDTSSAGAKSGSVTLNYVSDGAGTSGLAGITAGSQTVNVSGNVYRLATANTLGAINFGNVHVGDTVQQALNISNTAVADGFSESLNASFGAGSDARITTSGSINQLAAGSSNNSSMIVGLNTSAAGTVNGTQTINFASDGAGTSGLGITALPSQTIGVSGDITTNGSVFRLASASPATPNPVSFGNVRIGSAADQVLSISNTAANDNFSEKLNVSISSNGAPVTASGSFNLLGPQATDSTSLHVGIDTSSAGAKSGSATIALVSDGAGTSNLGTTNLPSQTVNVSGNVYRLANPTLNTPSVNLAARVGDAAPSASVSVTNNSPDSFTEGLKASIGGASTPFTSNGAIASLAAQGTDASSLQVSLNTATAGASVGTATVDFISTGAGTTGAADVSVGSALVNLAGKVYQQAVAQVNTLAVNFGIVHRGDAVAPVAVSVSNAAPAAGLNDVLRGSLGGASGPFSASGDLGTGVTAGATDGSSLTVGLNTGATGVFNGLATASLLSHNADMSDLALGNTLVSLSAQVNDFANADLRKTGGDGILSRNALNIVLDFGNMIQGSGLHTSSLDIFNNVIGPADLLDGLFNFIDADDFLFGGFDPFADLAAGFSRGGLSVGFDATTLGSFSDTLILASLGHNASGFSGNLSDITFRIQGNVIAGGTTVPEPESLLLVAIGIVALLAARRRHVTLH